jgi:hypothetical protein
MTTFENISPISGKICPDIGEIVLHLKSKIYDRMEGRLISVSIFH